VAHNDLSGSVPSCFSSLTYVECAACACVAHVRERAAGCGGDCRQLAVGDNAGLFLAVDVSEVLLRLVSAGLE
jgi:hypothetical protein